MISLKWSWNNYLDILQPELLCSKPLFVFENLQIQSYLNTAQEYEFSLH